MFINSYVEYKLGFNESINHVNFFVPIEFYPPDITGKTTLTHDGKLLFYEGNTITLTAPEKYNGKDFSRWLIKSDNINIIESDENPISIVVGKNFKIYAVYDPISITTWNNIIVGANPIEPLSTELINSYSDIIIGATPVEPLSLGIIETFVEIY